MKHFGSIPSRVPTTGIRQLFLNLFAGCKFKASSVKELSWKAFFEDNNEES